MVVGILSDTHGWLDPQAHEVLADCDVILHAGDIGSTDVLDELEGIGPPVHAVFGNVDGWPLRHRAPERVNIDLGGLRVLMIHIGGSPGRWARGVPALLDRFAPGVFVCGHSHILRVERVADRGGMLYLNPGAAGRQGFHQVRTCLRLHIEAGRATKADVVHFS